MLNKLHIFTSLIAGIIYTIYSLLHEFEFFFWLKNVISVLIIFFILGLVTKKFLAKAFEPVKEEVVEVTEEEILEEENETENSSEDVGKPRRRFDFSRDEDDDN